MTVIAAYRDDDGFAIAADSQSTFGELCHFVKDKLIVRHNWILGSAGIGRAAELIAESDRLDFPIKNDSDVIRFRDDIQQIFSDAKMFDKDNNTVGESPVSHWDGLLVTKKLCYRIFCDMTRWRVRDYVAIGSGEQIALGVMYALKLADYRDAKFIAGHAVRAAIKHEINCGGKIQCVRPGN